MTRAMILCAGYGTRLGTLSDERPKPMLPVLGLPILRYGIANLVGHGITDIIINLHHRGQVIREELGDGSAFGARLRYLEEEVILGTGGGLKNALPLLDPDGTDEPFVSLNGKLIFDVDLGALLAAHRADPEALGTMVVRPVPNAREWGAVEVRPDAQGRLRVRNILDDGGHMFLGVHVTRPSVVARLPDGEACMVRQGYLPWLRAGAAVGAHVVEQGYFAEHSTPARYVASNLDLLHGAPLRFPPGPTEGVDADAIIEAGAELVHPVRILGGARIGSGARVGPDVVVGANATVAEGATLERTIVWAGATATGKLKDAIVTATGTVDARE